MKANTKKEEGKTQKHKKHNNNKSIYHKKLESKNLKENTKTKNK